MKTIVDIDRLLNSIYQNEPDDILKCIAEYPNVEHVEKTNRDLLKEIRQEIKDLENTTEELDKETVETIIEAAIQIINSHLLYTYEGESDEQKDSNS